VDHLFLQFPKIDNSYNQEIDPFWRNKGDATTIVPQVAKVLDDIVQGIYNQFKDQLPKD
jgi:hypothetical protein